ncbi:DUF1360 domain-containing protein [Alkalihalophilus pseudofirmus]|uniref:DUF1360 domain-containing protein n=1 Tax=Alkalihalophilus pseudofirmus TaxID=79885 RepID=UPI00259B25A4|nr:DUF1360 domain-containing protein [Alkalihalophilus pseudofirmus]WEG15919.1 DUF1360 domain-containing protein [Alkalihalophilus pseudofirmus]
MENYIVSLFEFFLLSFAVFRFTHLIVLDEITDFMRRPFTAVVEEIDENGEVYQYIEGKGSGIQKWIGNLLNCYWCFGVWASILLYAGFVLFPVIFTPVIYVLAIAGVAALIETFVKQMT